MSGTDWVVRPAGLWVREHRLLTMVYHYGGAQRNNLPGGKPDPGETLRACLEREFTEELGVGVRVGELLHVVETHAGGRDVVHLVFEIIEAIGEPRLNPDQTHAHGLAWLEAEAIGEIPLYPAIGPWIAAWMRGGRSLPVFGGEVPQDWF